VQQDNLDEAINVLAAPVKRNKKDIRAWHWLATALEKQRQLKNASKAHENAAKTAEELQIAASDDFKSLPAIELLEAADSAEHYLALNSSISEKKRNEWLDRADFLRVQATTTVDKKIYKNSEVTIRARVLRKDEPSYTTEARNNLVTGMVALCFWCRRACASNPRHQRTSGRTYRTGDRGCTANQIHSSDERWKARFDVDATRVQLQFGVAP
jgi:hypothetical protein